MKDLKGRVAVITGAASGIGWETARLLAQQGCSLALVDIDTSRLQIAAKELEVETGVRISAHIADVADPERMEALAKEVHALYGPVHVLVNNAGVSVLKSFEEHSLEDLHWLLGVNFWGVVYGCRFFLPLLREADEAAIVNVSSMFGFIGVPGQSSYCASKFAVRGFSESLEAELRGSGIAVTSVHPGGISTGIVRNIRVNEESARDQLQQSFDRFGHPPSSVAKAILRGIRKKKFRVRVGAEAYGVDWLKRLMPVGFHKLFGSRMRVPGS